MPDVTVTDDDRKAHEWADQPVVKSNSLLAPIGRSIKAHVPAPPATLAEQILDIAGCISSDFGAYSDDLTALADRAEAVEKENHDMERELNNAWDERDEAREKLADKLDEVAQLHTEVERLTSDREQQEKALTEHGRLLSEARAAFDEVENRNLNLEADLHAARAEVERLKAELGVPADREYSPPVALPDPADVPEDESWIVELHGIRSLGIRNDATGSRPWQITHLDNGYTSTCGDDWVTLVARLVPDMRRVIDTVEDLDALPVGSVVLDVSSHAWEKYPDDDWYSTELEDGFSSRRLIRLGQVTVIYEPMVD